MQVFKQFDIELLYKGHISSQKLLLTKNALDNQCAKYEPSTTKHVRDIALQSIQPASNYFENKGSNVILAIILQDMKHLCQKHTTVRRF